MSCELSAYSQYLQALTLLNMLNNIAEVLRQFAL